MRVPQLPACGIDFRRTFSLPLGVAPESLSDEARTVYAVALDIRCDILNSTFGAYHHRWPARDAVRLLPTVANPAVKVLLPLVTPETLPEARLSAADISNVNRQKAVATPFPAGSTAASMAARMDAKAVRDVISQTISHLAVPYIGMDALRFYFPPKAAAGFEGTLGLEVEGVPTDATLPAALPTCLLTTRSTPALEIGELDRLLLRAPVAGAYRFEPYHHYQSKPAKRLEALGLSNSGRLLVQQAYAKLLEEKQDETHALVFRARTLAFEHVDRGSVAELLHRNLALHVRAFPVMIASQKPPGADEPRLAIPEALPSVLSGVCGTLNNLLRAWVAYLKILAPRPEDTAVAAALPPEWELLFPLMLPNPVGGLADTLVAALARITADPAWLESLLHFSQAFYAPLLSGHSWFEVLSANGLDPLVVHFPGTADAPPFSTKEAALIQQHDRLRLVEDPRHRWVTCYAGCPIGRPSRVYGDAAPPAGSAFPAGAYTTYELEALHAAGQVAGRFTGLDPAAVTTPAPTPGFAMDLTPFQGKAIGHVTIFQSSRIYPNVLYGAVDWLLELTRGIHWNEREAGWLALDRYMDPATGNGHPLLQVLRLDDSLRAQALRNQLNTLLGTSIAADNLNWWKAHLNFATTPTGEWEITYPDSFKIKPTPEDPYRDDRTRPTITDGARSYEDLKDGSPSGFATFDIESIALAASRMRRPAVGGAATPLAVGLALLETEGVKFFAALHRSARYVTAAKDTFTWEAISRDPTRSGPASLDEEPPREDQIARVHWLVFPYGLDEFTGHQQRIVPDAEKITDALFKESIQKLTQDHILRLDRGEDVERYFRQRLWSEWHDVVPGAGVPRIWMRSRTAHWACISLMLGWFAKREYLIRHPTLQNRYAEVGWSPSPGWFPAGSSPPDLAGKGPNDAEWKDFISYYALVYLSYNISEAGWREIAKAVEADCPAGTPLRDYLLFRQDRHKLGIANMARFAIGLDAFLRLNFMEGLAPGDYAAAAPNTTALSRTWVLP
jgi:hypothetical protein